MTFQGTLGTLRRANSTHTEHARVEDFSQLPFPGRLKHACSHRGRPDGLQWDKKAKQGGFVHARHAGSTGSQGSHAPQPLWSGHRDIEGPGVGLSTDPPCLPCSWGQEPSTGAL